MAYDDSNGAAENRASVIRPMVMPFWRQRVVIFDVGSSISGIPERRGTFVSNHHHVAVLKFFRSLIQSLRQ